MRQKSFKLLIVDKDPLISKWFQKKFKNYPLHSAKTSKEACQVLETESIDALLLDETFLDKDFKALAKMINHGSNKEQKLLVMTKKPTSVFLEKALKYGACDLITKPLETFDVYKALRLALRQQTHMNSLFEMLDVYKKRAYHDSLTHLYNRRMLFEQGDKEIAKTKRLDQPLSILMIDIDHFKKVNSNYGHLVGDSFLVQIAGLLQANLRSYDFICRFGGEEFVIILPNTPLKKAQFVAEKLRQSVEEYSFFHGKGFFKMTCSIGVCKYTLDTASFESLLAKVDSAVMQAKKNGRNCVYTIDKDRL